MRYIDGQIRELEARVQRCNAAIGRWEARDGRRDRAALERMRELRAEALRELRTLERRRAR